MVGAALALVAGCSAVDEPSTPESSSSSAATGGAGGGVTTTSASSGAGGGGTLLPDGCYDRLAGDVVLDDVTLFQVVAIDALRDGVEVLPDDRNAPLVESRAAVVRAHVEVGASFAARELGARITVNTSAGEETFLAKAMTNGATDFLVDLPATAIEEDATYSVAIVECEAPTGTPSSEARYPKQGEADVGAIETGTIKIHMVPYEVNGFVPDTSAPVIEGIRDAVYAVYPVTDVTITVGPVWRDWSDSVDMGGVLVDTGILQENEDLPADVYYLGMVTGAATRDEFCKSCPTGTSQELSDRAGFAAFAAFADQKAEGTVIHELGHLHMLKHAPCGDPDNVDPDFPYDDADITVEGYDVRTGELVPSTHKDMMAYCYPRWISDYNYAKLADWVETSQGW